jgi:hypothetical protein
LKLKSDNKFFELLKNKKTVAILLVALSGAVLIFISGKGEITAAPETDELTELCSSLEGVGECRTVINYGKDGEVLAVAVLCQGAEQIEVRSKLYKLISNLYGLGYNRISVLKISE